MIIWNDTIGIIAKMFEITQEKIAALMGYNKSTISKVKSGKQPPPFKSEEVFERIFDPSNPKTPRANEHETQLLNELKLIIEKDFKGVKKDMEDCWEEKDYRIFVLRILDRTRSRPITKGEDDSVPADTSITASPLQSPCNPNEEVFNFFYKAMRDNRIDEFLGCVDPTDVISIEYSEGCDAFVRCLEDTGWLPDTVDAIKKTDIIVQKVLQFAQTVDAYNKYLALHMRPMNTEATELMVPLYRDENTAWAHDFEARTKEYREQLSSLFQEIWNIVSP